MDTVLTDFYTVNLAPMVPQEDCLDLLIKGMAKAIAVQSGKESDKQVEKIVKWVKLMFSHFAPSPGKVGRRYMSIWPENFDYKSFKKVRITDGDRFVSWEPIFPMFSELAENHREPEGCCVGERMDIYRRVSQNHINELYKNVSVPAEQMIHVTSTGYCSPNPVEVMAGERQWSNVEVSNVYNKACNAAIPAIRSANSSLRSSYAGQYERPKRRIDIIHSEMFSLHIKLTDLNPVNVGMMGAISDSFIRYSLLKYDDAFRDDRRGLKYITSKDFIVPHSASIGGWKVSAPSFDFDVDLLKYYRVIGKNMHHLVDAIFADLGMPFGDAKDDLVFALQASSNLLINEIKKGLKLSEEQVIFSRNLLYENGYLSSAAIPFMCKKIIESHDIPVGQKVLCIGQAEGVTLSALLLEKV